MICASHNLSLSPHRSSPLTLSHAYVFVSEVVADDTPAVQAVLKADTRRLKLLEEEKQLQARLEKGEDSVAERLDKVSVSYVCHHAAKMQISFATFSFNAALKDVSSVLPGSLGPGLSNFQKWFSGDVKLKAEI